MDPLDARLRAYPALTPHERAAVAAEVEDRARAGDRRWEAPLGEALALAALLDQAARPAYPDPVALAEHIAEVEAGRAGDPAVARALAQSPALQRAAAAIAERLARLSREAEDPVALYERLAGTASPPEHAPPEGHPPRRGFPDRPAARSAPARPRRAPRVLRYGGALAALVAVLWGGLFVAGPLMQPERQRMAGLGEIAAFSPPVFRGAAEDGLARYGELAAQVGAARQTTLGLFPRYDPARLAALAPQMDALAAEAPPASPLAQEAGLASARLRLYVRDDTAAATRLRALVRSAGYRAPEARRLLDYLRAQHGG